MTFTLSFAGVRVNITPSAPSSSGECFAVSSVKHCDGYIEADICNFSGKIIISEEAIAKQTQTSAETCNKTQDEPDIVVSGIPECPVEELGQSAEERSAPQPSNYAPLIHMPETAKINQMDGVHEIIPPVSPFLQEAASLHQYPNADAPPPNNEPVVAWMPQTSAKIHPADSNGIKPMDNVTKTEDSHTLNASEEEKKCQTNEETDIIKPQPRIRFSLPTDVESSLEMTMNAPKIDLSFHKACASEDADPYKLHVMLQEKPELACIQDEFGDYPAHIFADNESIIYTMESEYDLEEFVIALYKANPEAFLTEGFSGQIPFATAICDWIDECHQLYARDLKGVSRVSEIKTLTKSTRVINSLCVRDEVQKLMSLPTKVELTPKVKYSFKMLSLLLDKITKGIYEDVSFRREFFSIASKRRDKIISSVASLPFFARTILLIDDESEREMIMMRYSIIRNAMFRTEAVGLWVVALLSSCDRSKDCAALYLKRVSRLTLTCLFGKRLDWSTSDIDRFHHSQNELFEYIASLGGFVPCLLHLGDRLIDLSLERGVKHAVEQKIGRPLPVYLLFMETILLLILITTYRMIIELLYLSPSEEFLSEHREFWGLSLSIAVYFISRDLAIVFAMLGIEQNLWKRYVCGWGNIIGFVSMVSVVVMLSILHIDSSIMNKNYLAVVAGLLWWKFLLHTKGMSEHLSTLVYTIIEIAGTLKYFLCIFCIAIFFFSDMIEVYKKTSGECDGIEDGDAELDSFCTGNPLQSYLAMYSIMIGGFDVTSLEGASAFVCVLFIAASFCGVIVLVNILIAIVTDEYAKASENSCKLFARARLELAARQAARERLMFPPEDPRWGIWRMVWIKSAKIKHLVYFVVVEIFLIQVLMTCQSLENRGTLGNFLYVSLILCAILHHLFAVAVIFYTVFRIIRDFERFAWLRGSKFHCTLAKICLKPVCFYLASIGLGQQDHLSCVGHDHEGSSVNLLRKNEFLARQVEFERSVQASIKASEKRIIDAITSLSDLGNQYSA